MLIQDIYEYIKMFFIQIKKKKYENNYKRHQKQYRK